VITARDVHNVLRGVGLCVIGLPVACIGAAGTTSMSLTSANGGGGAGRAAAFPRSWRPVLGRTIEGTQRGVKAREAAMRLRAHRRSLVVWSSVAGSPGRGGGPGLTHSGRIPRWIRTGTLLMVIGLMRLARAVRPRWRSLLAGGTLTVAGAMASGAWGAVLLPGVLILLSAPLIPAVPRARRPEAELELAVFSHPAQRRLASQAIALGDRRFPGFLRHWLPGSFPGNAAGRAPGIFREGLLAPP